MADIPASSVKELRDRTGAGMLDCKKALTEAGGDIDAAILALRKAGTAKAEKRSGRDTAEGRICHYVHAGSRIAVLVELNCETDFVARTEDFAQIGHDVAMHVAAANPRFVRREDVDPATLAREEEVYRARALAEGKPAAVLEKIISGQLTKYYQDACLMEQPFVKNPDVTVEKHVQEKAAKMGENVRVRRFVRFALGD